MALTKSEKRDELLKMVRDASQRAEAYCARTRPWDTRLLVVSIVCGAAATVLAGGVVIGGDPAMRAFGTWKVLCSIVALLTASGTVAGALHKTLQITARVSNAEKCVAKLKALDASLATGNQSTDDALETFRRISDEHAGCLA